ncbi:MAG TPA: arabinan endo-1,5-alpha-L-arabinosidase [Pseudonocardia sp.]
MRLIPLVTTLAAAFLVAASLAAAPEAAAAQAPPAPAGPAPVGQLGGDLDAHDPALARGTAAHDWYVYSSGIPSKAGGAVQIRKSVDDGHTWAYAGTIWQGIPSWITDIVPGADSMWAPEIYRHGNIFYLYYAVSTLGHNNSVVALATNTTLDPAAPGYKWVDQGKVVRSVPESDFNAIDPDVVEDATGTPWLVFGSYWSGIQMVQLQWPSGKRSPDPDRLHLEDRKLPLNAVEGPAVIGHGGWYYLLTSWDKCCVGLKSTYRIVVGRSKSVTGPYVDRDGHDLMNGGGTTLLASSGNQIGPGGESIAGGVLAYHYYDAKANGAARLGLRTMLWTPDGWPQLAPGLLTPSAPIQP